MQLIWIRMGVNILFGNSSASNDKCLLLLLIFLPKAKLWALHSGWESAEPIPAGLAGVLLPEGGGQSRGLEQRAGELQGDPRHCAQGLEGSSSYAGSHSYLRLPDRGHLPSWGFIHTGKSPLNVSIIWIATVTTGMVHFRHLGYWWTHFQRALEKET